MSTLKEVCRRKILDSHLDPRHAMSYLPPCLREFVYGKNIWSGYVAKRIYVFTILSKDPGEIEKIRDKREEEHIIRNITIACIDHVYTFISKQIGYVQQNTVLCKPFVYPSAKMGDIELWPGCTITNYLKCDHAEPIRHKQGTYYIERGRVVNIGLSYYLDDPPEFHPGQTIDIDNKTYIRHGCFYAGAGFPLRYYLYGEQVSKEKFKQYYEHNSAYIRDPNGHMRKINMTSNDVRSCTVQ